MEVGVKVWVENTQTQAMLHVASAYLVFVAVDQNGRRVRVPELAGVTADEQRRWHDALLRREHREREHARRKEARKATAAATECLG
jgi:acyl-CoA hydrolase